MCRPRSDFGCGGSTRRCDGATLARILYSEGKGMAQDYAEAARLIGLAAA
jgi:hypothetical protein